MRDTVDWTFGGTWPYRPHWFDTPDGRMHYVDEGDPGAPAVVLVHGNPTWGYLYRNFVGPLVDAGQRVVVPDLLGFGRSDKPARRAVYAIDQHVARMNLLLDALDLRAATIVPQDWGGPIVLPWAVAHSDRVAGLFILNTAVHVPVRKLEIPLPLRMFRAPGLGEVLVKGLNAFHHAFLFRVGTTRPERFTKSVRAAYLAPHRSWSQRTGVLEFPRQIPAGPGTSWDDFARGVERGLATEFAAKPVRIVWAMKDPGFVPEFIDDMWLKNLPHAEVTRLSEAGHYLQEDAYELIVPSLIDFVTANGR